MLTSAAAPRISKQAGRLTSVVDSHKSRQGLWRVARAWTLLLLGIAAFQVFIFMSPRFMERAALLTAQMTAWALRLLGAEAQANGRLVSSSVFSVEIIWECTAVFPIAVFVAAVLAYPCSWASKA